MATPILPPSPTGGNLIHATAELAASRSGLRSSPITQPALVMVRLIGWPRASLALGARWRARAEPCLR
jgi:hypothetical protein